MAIKEVLELTDDIDGGPAQRTVRFGFEGADYEIDLSEGNAAGLEAALAPYLEAARRVPPRRAGRTSGARRPLPARPVAPAAKPAPTPASAGKRREAGGARAPKEETSAIRAWAAENGFAVSERGRIPGAIRQAWAQATAGAAGPGD